jgi:hypothetical protein
MIHAFNFRNDLVDVAQLNCLPPSSSSSKYHIGRTPTRLLAFSDLAHLLCCTTFHCQSSIPLPELVIELIDSVAHPLVLGSLEFLNGNGLRHIVVHQTSGDIVAKFLRYDVDRGG